MPRGPIAHWNRHQYKKAAMPVYAIAASAGSRGNVGKLCPAGHGQSDKGTGAKTGFSGFRTNFPGREFKVKSKGLNSVGRSVPGGSLQSCKGWCNSNTGFHFVLINSRLLPITGFASKPFFPFVFIRVHSWLNCSLTVPSAPCKTRSDSSPSPKSALARW